VTLTARAGCRVRGGHFNLDRFFIFASLSCLRAFVCSPSFDTPSYQNPYTLSPSQAQKGTKCFPAARPRFPVADRTGPSLGPRRPHGATTGSSVLVGGGRYPAGVSALARSRKYRVTVRPIPNGSSSEQRSRRVRSAPSVPGSFTRPRSHNLQVSSQPRIQPTGPFPHPTYRSPVYPPTHE